MDIATQIDRKPHSAWFHFSSSDQTITVPIVTQSTHFKPRGLWVSDQNTTPNWKSWCESEEFQIDGLRHQHKVNIRSNAKIRHIHTSDALDRFTSEYAVKLSRDSPSNHLIDWATVAASWDGILITPYLYARRLNRFTAWYYGWDCASGCIWHPRAIESIVCVKDSV